MATILITGANRGIGLELARQSLAAGWRVLAACRRPGDAADLHALAAEGDLALLPLDVTDDASVAGLVEAVGEAPVDVLVNNAGVFGGPHQAIGDVDYDAWREAFEINTLAPFRVTTALLDALRRAERPRVLVISSQMGALSRRSRGVYAYRSTKAAANKVAQLLALDLEAEGIVVAPVHPGWVRTDMGGENADLSVAESAAGLLALIERLGPEDSGRFWTWAGDEHDW